MLYLDSNYLTALYRTTLSDLIGLQYLVLSDNRLTTVADGSFAGLSALDSLFLSSNDLQALTASTVAGLTGLGHLSLALIRPTLIDPRCFDSMTRLVVLYLNNNNLTALNSTLFDRPSLQACKPCTCLTTK
eukprot:m.727597 g.727597  ORF g.727597 m.727597 type:complete len:131 (+) comp58863_c0_seq21:1600-1992(+)